MENNNTIQKLQKTLVQTIQQRINDREIVLGLGIPTAGDYLGYLVDRTRTILAVRLHKDPTMLDILQAIALEFEIKDDFF